jgi:hypothetical protein
MARSSLAQVLADECPASGFDVCFPNMSAGAPDAVCVASEQSGPQASLSDGGSSASGRTDASASDAGRGDAGPALGRASDGGISEQAVSSPSISKAEAADVNVCLRRICGAVAAEPEPGFFHYCCARGGAGQYDDYCAFIVQSECAPVAALCADRCPSVALLTGTVSLAPPPALCIASYPAFIGSVCKSDPFCCSTSWDSLCAGEALGAREAL